MTNNQLKKTYSSCFLLKNKAIMEEVNNLVEGYKVDSINSNNSQYVVRFSDKNKNTITMIIDNGSIHVTRFENNVYSNISIFDTQVMRQSDIEKRDKGLVYTETCKRFARSRKFNNSPVLTDLEQENYTFSADTINTILNGNDYKQVEPNQILIRLKSLGMKANLEDAADLFTTFSTHMNYYYGWDGGRQITDNFYPTKTLVNGENLSMLFDVNDGPDKLYRVYDLYRGVINPRNEGDIMSINSGFMSEDSFDYKRFIGITDTEEEIAGESKKTLSTEYVDYLTTFFKEAFGYTGSVELDRFSLLSAINYQAACPELETLDTEISLPEEKKDKPKSFLKRIFGRS